VIKLKKLLAFVILAAVVLLCSTSPASAWVSVTITPDKQYTCPQISEFWSGSAPCTVCHADKTVTYAITVESDSYCLPASITVVPRDTPASWFSWLNKQLNWPDTSKTWLLDIKVPLTMGKDAGGTYTFTVTATDSCGSSAQSTATLVVQDHDYVSESLIAGEGWSRVDEKVRNMGIATKVDKVIDFSGYAECIMKNEYVIQNARGSNANFEQESVVSEYRAVLPGDSLSGYEQFKSCAALGGSGVDILEGYDVTWMESRCENLNHHVTGDQRWKTELCTYNTFEGELLVDARQTLPCCKSLRDTQSAIGNLTVGKHLIYRRP
jgi:hypothetical protein